MLNTARIVDLLKNLPVAVPTLTVGPVTPVTRESDPRGKDW